MKYKKITWEEFDEGCEALAKVILKNKKIVKLYGVMRGGWPVVVKLSHLTKLPVTETPSPKNTAIIDDILDGGTTRKAFKKFPYFYTLVTKSDEEKEKGIWYIFPWEEKK